MLMRGYNDQWRRREDIDTRQHKRHYKLRTGGNESDDEQGWNCAGADLNF